MIVVLKPGVQEEKRTQLIEWLKGMGLGIHISDGDYQGSRSDPYPLYSYRL